MNVMNLLEYLQDIVETSYKVPLTGKVMVNKKEILDTIDQIISYLPDEFKKAQWVFEEKERILSEAAKQANDIKKENIELLKKQVENHDIIKEARIRAEEIIASAQKDAKAMRLGARDYADEILSQLQNEIEDQGKEFMSKMTKDAQEFLNNFQEDVISTNSTIRQNIKELRNVK